MNAGLAWGRRTDRWICSVGPLLGRVVRIACTFSHLRRLCGREKGELFACELLPGFVDWDHFELDWEQVSVILAEAGFARTLLEQARSACDRTFEASVIVCNGV